jgi:serine/threonine protein kinase
MEKFCPSCSRAYEDSDLTHCELDGERLIVMQTEVNLVGQELDGKYLVRAKLGEGGMGTVYVAEQRSMGREVAVKILRPRFSQNRQAIKYFLREARAASRLTHPNTITVYDSGQTPDGLLYQVMERLTGRPLSALLEAEGRLAVPRAIAILSQICDSLAEAHLQGITHRDLKPENIFIEPTVGNPEFVKVLDFGIAKIAEDSGTNATATGMICGTPSYMSPEQTMGRALDGRSDIYALGVLLYEIIAGTRPFPGQTPMEIMLKHINEAPPPLPEALAGPYSERLHAVLQRMLAKLPDGRPADCQALKRELATVLDPSLPMAARVGTDPSLRETVRRDSAPDHSPAGATPVGRDPSEFTGLSSAIDPSTITAGDFRPSRWEVRAAVAAAVVLLGVGGAWFAWRAAASGTPPAAGLEAPTGATGGPESAKATAPSSAPVPAAAKHEPAKPADAAAKPSATEAAASAGTLAGAAVGSAALAVGDTAAAEPAEPEPAAAEPPGTPEPELAVIEAQIDSTPRGATVTSESGETLGTTPFTLAMPAGAPPREVSFALEGHKTQTATVDSKVPETWTVKLHRAPRKVIGSAASKPGRPPSEPKPEPSKPPTFGHGTF